MNIIHIITDLDQSGGAQRLVVDMSINSKSYKPSIVTLREPKGDLLKLLQEHNVKVIHIPITRFIINKLGLAEQILNIEPNNTVIHVHLFPSLYVGAFQKRYRSVYTEHSTGNRRRKFKILRPLEKLIYGRYDRLVGISNGVSKSLERWISRNKIETIYNGIDITKYRNNKKKYWHGDRYSNNYKIGMLGRLSSQKNQDLIIKALKSLPDNIELHIGGDGYRINELKNLAIKYDLQNRVKFHGYISNSISFIRELDLYIQSSHIEGFGLTIIEAMALGVPFIGSDIPGLSEIIGKKELLFKNDSITDIIRLINYLLFNEEKLNEISEYGLNRSREFDINMTVKKYEKIYTEIVRN